MKIITQSLTWEALFLRAIAIVAKSEEIIGITEKLMYLTTKKERAKQQRRNALLHEIQISQLVILSA